MVLAGALRLLWALSIPSRPVGDFALYREAAAYLVEHGHLDPEFIYMPGYVFLLAAVQFAGGGLLAQKMIAVVFGTALVAASAGIADRLFGRRAGITAAAMLAIWPAGIAVSSVTGTDVPAGALVATGVFALLADIPAPPQGRWRGVLAAGLVMGLAGWVRAVAIPLVGLAVFVWRARGLSWRHSLSRAGLAMAVALVVLLPWGARNLRVYGHWFLTDSHGGHTALVGSNPNSDGTYSRSLNILFTRGTGFRLFDLPSRHRESDAAAYDLAKQWAAFEPKYAIGLLGAKADRLLTHERNLLYWPIFRSGVLDSGLPGVLGTGDASRAWFERHRALVEHVTDGFWWIVGALGIAGISLGFFRLQRPAAWLALAVAAFPCALTVIYTVFFAEVRYHLAIAPLLFPYAAFALTWLFIRARDGFRGDGRALIGSATLVGLVILGYSAALVMAARLREEHRWAISTCRLPDRHQTQLCAWRRQPLTSGPRGDARSGAIPGIGPGAATRASPLRGVWDGVGLRLDERTGDELAAAAETVITLPAGRYRVHASLALVRVPPSSAERARAGGTDLAPSMPTVALRVGDTVFARAVFGSPAGEASELHAAIEGVIDHSGGALRLNVEVESPSSRSTPDGKTLWISDLSVERFQSLEIIAPQ